MHFTYNQPDISTLKQGDILQRTDALNVLIHEIHPYFSASKYTHFQIVTQTCDNRVASLSDEQKRELTNAFSQDSLVRKILA